MAALVKDGQVSLDVIEFSPNDSDIGCPGEERRGCHGKVKTSQWGVRAMGLNMTEQPHDTAGAL